MSGATIIAPMTVAVESETTPAPAITAARTRSTQNRLSWRLTLGPSKKSCERMRATSLATRSNAMPPQSSKPTRRSAASARRISWLAMTLRWISLVPSPTIISGASR